MTKFRASLLATLALAALFAPLFALASEEGGEMASAQIDLTDKASLQRGAALYMNYCSGCHSLNYQRYSRTAEDLGLTQEEMEYISDWVEGGAPEGNPKMLPKKADAKKWQDPESPAGSSELDVAAGAKLADSASVLAIRPKGLAKGASVQVIAARPDGTFEPLLWIYNFNPEFARTYYYTSPVALPAGTEIEMSPADAGKVALYSKSSGKSKAGIGLK